MAEDHAGIGERTDPSAGQKTGGSCRAEDDPDPRSEAVFVPTDPSYRLRHRGQHNAR